MSYNTKNYTEQGGSVTHIGGKIVIDEGGSAEGFPCSLTPCTNQAASTAATVSALKDDFNSLLEKLKTAGLMEADTVADEPAETPEDTSSAETDT